MAFENKHELGHAMAKIKGWCVRSSERRASVRYDNLTCVWVVQTSDGKVVESRTLADAVDELLGVSYDE